MGGTHMRLQREHDDNNRNTRGITSIIKDVDNSFKGSTPDIGDVLALKTERVTKKIPFENFRELLVDYLVKELEQGM